jgi:DNA polymerase III epsilon subunit-like protein
MKYFIDFEATQYTHEIIEIGCVREDGRQFKAYIRPRKLKNVTWIITELTGITKDMLEKERDSDAVFSAFFDWLSQDKTPVHFFCYGSSDLIFVTNNIQKCTHRVKSQAALSLIAANLTDATTLVTKHFELERAPSLKKVMEYYFPNDDHIHHDALADADMLRCIYQAMKNEKKVKGIPFPDYIGTSSFKTPRDLRRFSIVRLDAAQNRVVYETFDDAKEFILKQSINNRAQIEEETVSKKLLSALNTQKTYYGYVWNAEVKTQVAEN